MCCKYRNPVFESTLIMKKPKKDIGEVSYEQLYAEPLISKDLRRIRALLNQLSNKPKELSLETFVEATEHSVVIVARLSSSKIIGMATLTKDRTYAGLVGRKGQMHDVVVDETFRGYGIARGLISKLKWFARSIGLEKVRFTSSPDRVAANGLYVSLGATRIETNVYQFDPEK